MTIDRIALKEAIYRLRSWFFAPEGRCAGYEYSWVRPEVQAVIAAAEAHLATLPKTKMVEVFRVEFAQSVECINSGKWEAASAAFTSRAEAIGYESVVRSWPNTACIRVTGPHMQEVPA